MEIQDNSLQRKTKTEKIYNYNKPLHLQERHHTKLQISKLQ